MNEHAVSMVRKGLCPGCDNNYGKPSRLIRCVLCEETLGDCCFVGSRTRNNQAVCMQCEPLVISYECADITDLLIKIENGTIILDPCLKPGDPAND